VLKSTTIIALLMIPVLCSALEIWVPDDQPTIQAAMDTATEGDSVVLRCGTYYEWDIQYKPNTTLRSENGDPSCVTIDAAGKGRCLAILHDHNRDSLQAWIEGISFINGDARLSEPSWGGAVYCDYDAEFSFTNCHFENNQATSGGAVSVYWASVADFNGCSFRKNSAMHSGGAVMGSGGTVRFYDCFFEENQAQSDGGAIRGSATYYGGYVYAYDTVFRNNQAVDAGGALFTMHGGLGRELGSNPDGRDPNPTIENCLFIGNQATYGGAVYTFYGGRYYSHCHFEDNTGIQGGAVHSVYIDVRHGRSCDYFEKCSFLNNSGSEGALLFVEGYSSPYLVNSLVVGHNTELVAGELWFEEPPIFLCCNIFGNHGGNWTGLIADLLGIDGNISLDPLLCPGSGNGSAYLQSDSPCAEGNNPECGQIGAWGVGCTAARATSWSQLKSMY
jgi:predicted outer membrane repeat protein